jgi:hypothetical protein
MSIASSMSAWADFSISTSAAVDRKERTVVEVEREAAHGEDVGTLVAHDQVDRVVGHDIARERGDGLELAGQDGGARLGRDGAAGQADAMVTALVPVLAALTSAARPALVTMAVRPMGSSAQEMAGAVQDRRA